MVVSRKPLLRKGTHSHAVVRIVGDRYFVATRSHASSHLIFVNLPERAYYYPALETNLRGVRSFAQDHTRSCKIRRQNSNIGEREIQTKIATHGF